MKITDPNWHTPNDGETWTLHGSFKDSKGLITRRKLFDVAYLGRGRGGGPMRWQVYDRRFWVDSYLEPIPEFQHVHEAKAWVDTVVRLT